HPEFGEFSENNGCVTYRCGTETVDVHPYFLPGRPQEGPSLLVYSGISANKAVFTSRTGDVHRSRDVYHALTRSLATSAATETPDSHCPTDHIADRLRQVTERTIRRLTQLKQYRPEITIDRAELDLLLSQFISGEDRLLVVEGLQGAGKTTWLCRVAERRLER